MGRWVYLNTDQWRIRTNTPVGVWSGNDVGVIEPLQRGPDHPTSEGFRTSTNKTEVPILRMIILRRDLHLLVGKSSRKYLG